MRLAVFEKTWIVEVKSEFVSSGVKAHHWNVEISRLYLIHASLPFSEAMVTVTKEDNEGDWG